MKFFLLTLALMPCLIMADMEEYTNVVKKLSALRMDNYFLKDYDFAEASKVNGKFSCPPIAFSDTIPTSVHKLRPSDINVVGAIGDSLTAANGARAKNVLELLNEYRGVSWSIGGDEDINTVVTIPNIIKQYNPNVKGFSVGVGNADSEGANFNVGKPGHTSHNILNQAKNLYNRILESPDVDFHKDWKLVTLFIGGNDVCKACEEKYVNKYTTKNYLDNVKATLDFLKNNMPRTLVNLVTLLDVTGISKFQKTNVFCKLLTTAFCRCGLDTDLTADTLKMIREIQAGTENLINSGRYDEKDDFTVVMQPFLKENEPPKDSNGEYDLSYFAPDCFHFSEKGHASGAFELWNNMFEKVGQKSETWQQLPGDKIKCPSNSAPYIYTSKNSN